MALCSVTEVKAIVSPKTVTDAEITSIIDLSSLEIAIDTGASEDASENTTLNLACIHKAAAYVLGKAKTTGELAKQATFSNSSQQNDVENDIKNHFAMAARLVKKYNYSSSSSSIIYGRVGVGTVNSEAVHD